MPLRGAVMFNTSPGCIARVFCHDAVISVAIVTSS
jgi:hypothetical protein